MQDVQNIPNPDTSPNPNSDDFGSHSDIQPETPESDVENPGNDANQHIPTPDSNDFPSDENSADNENLEEADLL